MSDIRLDAMRAVASEHGFGLGAEEWRLLLAAADAVDPLRNVHEKGHVHDSVNIADAVKNSPKPVSVEMAHGVRIDLDQESSGAPLEIHISHDGHHDQYRLVFYWSDSGD